MLPVMAPARWQAEMIERARHVARSDARIRAVWLGGSFGSGEQDEFSDVDLHCLVDATQRNWFADHWRDLARQVAGAPLVLARDIPGVLGGYVLTDRFRHLDLIVHAQLTARSLPADELYHGHPSLVLYDPDRLLPPPPARAAAGGAYFPSDPVTFFFYLLHAFSVSMQRGELALARAGVPAVQDPLVAVMLAENGVRQRGGNKRLNRYLTAEQRDCLEQLPATDGSAAATIAAIAYLTREFIGRGRRLAKATGQAWPRDLETAALAHLHATLGIDPAAWRPG